MEKGKELYERALKEARKKEYDEVLVKRLLDEAIEIGNADATYALATWHLFGMKGIVRKDFKKAYELLIRSAEKDHKEACYDLGVCYEEGKGVSRNFRKTFQSYLKGALLGDSQSVYEVGRCYYYGIGIPKNKTIAQIWLDRAEQLGVDS